MNNDKELNIEHNWVVMGVSGCGKSAIGSALAQRVNARFIDADDLHSTANIEKMKRGEPLTDEDRTIWLDAIGSELANAKSPIIVACSALKKSYRDQLRSFDPEVGFIYLEGSQELIAERLKKRSGHFMPVSLLTSQFNTLEPPQPSDTCLYINIDQPIPNIINEILDNLKQLRKH